MPKMTGGWKTATIAASAQLSDAIDLDGEFEYMDVILPAMTDCGLEVHTSDASGGTYQALIGDNGLEPLDVSTGAVNFTFLLGGWRFIKLNSDVVQGAERLIKVRGWNSD